jgi:two-component system, OmpR family, response regulator
MLRITTNAITKRAKDEQDQIAKAGYVLVFDEDPSACRLVVDYLGQQLMQARSAKNKAELRYHLDTMEAGVIVLGLPLEQEDDRLEVIKDIRICSDAPIIVMGRRVDEAELVIGLELGADEYLNSPVNLRELLARVRSLLRRQGMGAIVEENRSGDRRFQFGEWQLEERRRTITNRSGHRAKLRQSEFLLLRAFIQAPQRILTREQLLDATRSCRDVGDRSIDVRVMRLRRKLSVGGDAPGAILTHRGIGYIFVLDVASI